MFDQTLEAGLRFLEDGLAKHAVLVSEEHQHRTRELEQLRSLLGSPQTAAIVQLHERQITRRTKATDHLNTFYFVSDACVLKWCCVFFSAPFLTLSACQQALLDQCETAASPLRSASAESEQRLEDQRRETLTLLQGQHGTLPKTEAELLQDYQRVSLQLQQTQKQMEVRRAVCLSDNVIQA